LSQIISITALSSISPLGNDPTVIWQNYLNDKHYFVKEIIDNAATFIAPLSVDAVDGIEALKMSDTKYKFLDKSVLYAIEVSRKAVQQAGWSSNDVFESTWFLSWCKDLFENTIRSI
jgi:3-oxoacyl-(acyl-carrier-protein) synthase